MPIILTAAHAQLFGHHWHPGRLREEPPAKAPDHGLHNILVERHVSPTATSVRTTHLFANCPDRAEHLEKNAEDAANQNLCPGCQTSYQSGPNTAQFPPVRICDHHRRHSLCHRHTTILLHDETEAIIADDGTQLQDGVHTDFTDPATAKLRIGWERTPSDLRRRINAQLHHMAAALDEATLAGDAARLTGERSKTRAAALTRMEKLLSRAAARERTEEPAIDNRHLRLRLRLTALRRAMAELTPHSP